MSYNNKQFSWQDFSPTIPRLLARCSVTFPWQVWYSPTFPGCPNKWKELYAYMEERRQKARQTWTWRAWATNGSLRSDRPLSPTASLHNTDTTSTIIHCTTSIYRSIWKYPLRHSASFADSLMHSLITIIVAANWIFMSKLLLVSFQFLTTKLPKMLQKLVLIINAHKNSIKKNYFYKN